jgi:hypothetical protein
MGVPTLEVSYISATTGRGDREVHKGHVVALEKTLSASIRSAVFACEVLLLQQDVRAAV